MVRPLGPQADARSVGEPEPVPLRLLRRDLQPLASLKTERVRRKVYRTRDEARADVFDYIERFYNPKRRHSTIGYVSPAEFERMAELA